MPKCKLEYNLPEEKSDFILASKAQGWYSALFDLDQYLRNKLKYGNDFKSTDETLETVREYLHSLMEDNSISFDDVE